MNTSKQVNVMVGLLFLLVIAFGIYFVWDQNVRSEVAGREQVEDNARRGGKLFATNCRVCHGVQGLGSLENTSLPGLPLDVEANRPAEENELKPLRQRFFDTISCGRVGTLMPPWSQAQGGPLNDTQIDQLVTLITGSSQDGPSHNPNEVSQLGWEEAVETAHEQDALLTPGSELLSLAADLSKSDTTISLNDAHVGLAADQFLRVENEVVQVKTFPASSKLSRAVSADDTVLPLEASIDFKKGVIVQGGQEKMRVTAVDAEAKTITVERGVEGTAAAPHSREELVQDPGNEITVERGAFSTDAAEHAEGAQVFNGPLPPPEGPLTGENPPVPCGQRAASAVTPCPAQGEPAPSPSPGQPDRPATAQKVLGEPEPPTDGVLETATRDNCFTRNNFKVAAGQQVTIKVTNEGQNQHDLRIAGLDGEWNTDDDFVAPPEGFLASGESGEVEFSLDEAATLVFRCDVHPTQMWGQVSVK
ncbi:MAG: c-type cytochrome [Chloroflexi bacterium]|nr:c-type cytochrome [Chloroflexota bacterium]